MRPGPGKPATVLIALFDVGGMQNAATPIGFAGSCVPAATIGFTKHSRCFVSVQLPAATPILLAEQSALLWQVPAVTAQDPDCAGQSAFCTQGTAVAEHLGDSWGQSPFALHIVIPSFWQ